jgi:hypothetical protein
MKTILPPLLIVFVLLLIGPTFVCAQQRSWAQPTSRNKLLSMLSRCAQQRPPIQNCNEDTAAYAISLYDRGDRDLLKPLLHLGLRGDGALAEILGDFYAEVLWRRPALFLNSLRFWARKEQKELAWMAGAADGGGMSDKMLRDVRRSLNKISDRRSNLSSLARLCLSEVNKANAAATGQ